MIDLSQLPDPEVIESLDFETLLAALKTDFKDRLAERGIVWDVDILETDPGVLLLETAAYRELLLRNRINFVARNQILAFSSGNDLEHLASFYGVGRLTGESDDRLRTRVRLAIVGRSPGGTQERFKGVCLGASLSVRDVAIWTEGRDPTIRVAVLSTDIGGAADQNLLDTVKAALEDTTVKLVSDRYEVVSAVRQVVDVTLTVRLAPSAATSILDDLPTIIVAAREEEDLLGLDLTRSWLIRAAMVSGVTDITVTSPAGDIEADPNAAIAIGTVTILDGGRGR